MEKIWVALLKLAFLITGIVSFSILLVLVLYRFFEYCEQPSNIVVLALILSAIGLNSKRSNS